MGRRTAPESSGYWSEAVLKSPWRTAESRVIDSTPELSQVVGMVQVQPSIQFSSEAKFSARMSRVSTRSLTAFEAYKVDLDGARFRYS
jgi:hypothetical protein